jgi:Na+(H+)/acetate symporter ActP
LNAWALVALVAVSVATLGIGAFGLRIARTTSDFFVASRVVRPGLNASAIAGEYLSAASFLGVAGLVLLRGADMLWYPVGWTAGYLMLLLFVAAPLRRSGAYTVPDFAELRLESRTTRSIASFLVVLICVFYLVPQLQGAGLTFRTLTGAPSWLGGVIVAVVVLLNVLAGGMRSITLVQAFQYWLKLVLLLVPLGFLLLRWRGDGAPTHHLHVADWVEPMQGPHAVYLTYSLVLATFLGTMGLPHVVVRFYTNPDGPAARRTTLAVLSLLGVFYLLPVGYAALGRVYAFDLIASGRADSVVLRLPGRIFAGAGSDLLTACLGAGAYAAFLSTSSGLVVSMAGVVSQDLLSRWTGMVAAFRVAAVVVVTLALVLAVASSEQALAHTVELAFAVAASTFCPLLVLGIWWRGLTAPGAMAGLVVGGLLSATAVVLELVGRAPSGTWGVVCSQPALLTVPAAFAAMIVGSLLTRSRMPEHVGRTMVRLHSPEELQVDRGSFRPRGVAPTVHRSQESARRR